MKTQGGFSLALAIVGPPDVPPDCLAAVEKGRTCVSQISKGPSFAPVLTCLHIRTWPS